MVRNIKLGREISNFTNQHKSYEGGIWLPIWVGLLKRACFDSLFIHLGYENCDGRSPRSIPCCMIFVDDVVLARQTRKEAHIWRKTFESNELKISRSKTKIHRMQVRWIQCFQTLKQCVPISKSVGDKPQWTESKPCERAFFKK